MCTQIVTVYLGRRGEAAPSMASSTGALASFPIFIWMCSLGARGMPGKPRCATAPHTEGAWGWREDRVLRFVVVLVWPYIAIRVRP